MPVPGAQSTNTGVIIGMTHFNTNSLTNGTHVAQIGTGQRWADVYEWISPYGLTVAGGRYGEVGVGGLLLGGGINNFGNSHVWSVSNIFEKGCCGFATSDSICHGSSILSDDVSKAE